MPNPIVTNHAWLRMLATELENKGFPPGYGPQLRHTAQILESAGPQIAELDRANIQLSVDLAAKEKEFAEFRLDMATLWRRYQSAVELISRYEPDTAINLAEYKPHFHELL